MKYLGSKNRIAKEILPIMTDHVKDTDKAVWIEPFVGGANMIDKINQEWDRIGYDINPHTIKALETIRDCPNDIPESLSEDTYKELRGKEPELVSSLLRFISSFSGKFDNGYARCVDSNGIPRNCTAEGKRNALKQSPNLQNVTFTCGDYTQALDRVYHILDNPVIIYCDPPYFNTTKYKLGKGEFNSVKMWLDLIKFREFRTNVRIFVSEYSIPDCVLEKFSDCIKEVWSKEVGVSVHHKKDKSSKRVEKLFEIISK